MGWITRYRKWRTQRQFKLMTDDEAKAQKSQSLQQFRSQRRHPLSMCRKAKKNYSMYMLLQSDTIKSWDDSIEDTQATEMSTAPEIPLMAYYGSEDRLLLEHVNFLVLRTQPRAVATLYNGRNW